jgi:hypothetical protein
MDQGLIKMILYCVVGVTGLVVIEVFNFKETGHYYVGYFTFFGFVLVDTVLK